MNTNRFRQNLLNALVLFLLVGALHGGSAPQVVALREYIRFTINTDFDLQVVADKAKGLGTYTSRLNWNEVMHALVSEKLAALAPQIRR